MTGDQEAGRSGDVPLDMHDEQRASNAAEHPQDSDSYLENSLLVYTAAFHRRRGYCCGSGCRHCPFSPPHVKGTTTTA